jgi:hypothetical protein
MVGRDRLDSTAGVTVGRSDRPPKAAATKVLRLPISNGAATPPAMAR